MIDASIPLRAGQAGQINLAEMFAQQDAQKARQQDMDMRREDMDWKRQLHAEAQDEQKRKHIEEGLKDMASAVQWADTPEKWAQVQQHYGQYDPQLAQVPFEQREQSLIHLGQMSEYLKANAEKFQSIEAGGSLYGIKPNGSVREIVRANPGDQQFGQAAPQQGGVQEGATATNPQTGQKLRFQGGQWVPMGGAASNGSAMFP